MTDAATEAGLLAQIRAQPDDDQLRMVYADLLIARGDERGEYLQLAIDRQQHAWSEATQARWRELHAQRARWQVELGLGGLHTVSWERGLPGFVTATGEVVVRHAEALARLPIRSLTLHRDVAQLDALATRPLLATVEHLSLGSAPGGRPAIPADQLAALAASPHLGRLRELAFTQALDDAGARAVAPALGNLERLTIQGISAALTGAGLAALLAGGLPRLRALGLFQFAAGARGAEALAAAALPALEQLTLESTALGASLAQLFGAGLLAPVRELVVWNDDARAAMEAVVRAEHVQALTSLRFTACKLDDASVARLATAQLPRLASLVLNANQLERAGVLALAASTSLPALTELDLSDNPLRTGVQEFHEFDEDSDAVSGWYEVKIPREQLLALFAHRPGLRVLA